MFDLQKTIKGHFSVTFTLPVYSVVQTLTDKIKPNLKVVIFTFFFLLQF